MVRPRPVGDVLARPLGARRPAPAAAAGRERPEQPRHLPERLQLPLPGAPRRAGPGRLRRAVLLRSGHAKRSSLGWTSGWPAGDERPRGRGRRPRIPWRLADRSPGLAVLAGGSGQRPGVRGRLLAGPPLRCRLASAPLRRHPAVRLVGLAARGRTRWRACRGPHPPATARRAAGSRRCRDGRTRHRPRPFHRRRAAADRRRHDVVQPGRAGPADAQVDRELADLDRGGHGLRRDVPFAGAPPDGGAVRRVPGPGGAGVEELEAGARRQGGRRDCRRDRAGVYREDDAGARARGARRGRVGARVRTGLRGSRAASRPLR